MEKAFVNTKETSVSGTINFEAKKKELTNKLGSDATAVDTALAKEPILLKNGGTGILLGIGIDPKLQKSTKDIVVTLFDDMTPIAEINKNLLIEACQKSYTEDNLKGVKYLVPLLEHSVSLEYRFQNRIDAVGDISGLVFYFKK